MGFMLKMSICAKRHGSVVKSQLLRHSHTTRHNHCMVQAHRRKNPGFSSLKNNCYCEASMMKKCFFGFSSADVFSCKATGDDGRACAGACSQEQSRDSSTDARRAKTSAEGFLRFLLTTET